MIAKQILKIIFLSLALLVASCGDKPLFTDLAENTLVVKLKGTYESTNPAPWNTAVLGDSTQAEADSVIQHPNTSEAFPTVFKLDLAEMRLVDARGKNQAKFSIYREVFDDLTIDNSHDFFNGNGITLHNDDVNSGIDYRYVKLYIRKMVFNNAQQYVWNGTGWAAVSGYPVVTFHENEYSYQFDFNQYLTNSRYDSLRLESTYINEVFPVTIPISGGMMFDKENKQTVLEIRLVIKNFVKKYEAEVYDSNDNRNIVHYYAVSDWLQSVNPFETTLGGNLLGVATSYVPGKSGKISITNGTGSTAYYIIVPAGTSKANLEADYSISTATSARSGIASGCDLPVIPTFPTNSSSDMDGVLNYYLKTEQYKINWNSCANLSTYSSEWDTYHTKVTSFKIPPYVIYKVANDNTAHEVNLPAGTYDIWRVSPPAFASLFNGTDPFGLAPITTNVIVPEGGTHTENY